VPHTRSSARHLEITAAKSLDVAEAVAVDELTADDVGEDLKLAVRVRRETLSRLVVVSKSLPIDGSEPLTATRSSLMTRRAPKLSNPCS
jgi:hypothetical protein